MEIVTRIIKTPKKVIKAKEKTITDYIAWDGREFGTERDCNFWEEQLNYDRIRKSIKHKYVRLLSEIISEFYYIENEEQLEFMILDYHYFDKDKYTVNSNKIKVGEWYGLISDSDGDIKGVISLSEIKEAIKKLEGD